MNTKSYRDFIIVFFLISVMLSLEGIYLFYLSETLSAAVLVFTYIVIIVAIESLVLWLLSIISKNIISPVAGIIFTINIFVLKLDYFSFFYSLSDYLIIFLIILIGAIFGYFIHRILKNEKKIEVQLLLFSGVIFIAVPLILSSSVFDKKSRDDVSHNNILNLWGKIKFKEKPNIYLISFDSMIPGGIAQKYLDIRSEDLTYAKTINNLMLKVKTTLSPENSTKISLNNTMNLDQKNINHYREYFQGRYPSILTSILSSNGYVTTMGNSNNLFGNSGSYVDNFEVFDMPGIKESVLCIDEDSESIIHTRLFGVCSILGNFSSITDIFNDISTSKDQINNGWVSKVFKNIENVSFELKPQLSFYYIYRPIGHTPKNYRHTNLQQRSAYKDYFVENAGKLDVVLNNLIELIEKTDPQSIVVIFGDHGAWMSRGLNKGNKEDINFMLQDRHQIELAILRTKNACASEKSFYYSPSFSTPSRVLAAIFRCLAEDPGKVDQLVDFNN